jgi:alanine-glyoxylate transaminase/serine-glyoxylate transaminase/serine-pyruvate transaminase
VPDLERILMGPGPCNPYPQAMEAIARPLLGHLDPEFLVLLDETCDRLRTVFRTENTRTLPVSGTGSAGMEAAFVNIVGPGDTVVVGTNGLFGERMCDVAERCGATIVRVDAAWGTPLEPDRVLDAARAAGAKLIAAVHAETSTGVRNDIAALGAGKGDALLLMDCVTSLGGIPVEVDAWGVDIAYSGTQKCLGVPPGLAPFTMNDAAWERRVPRPQSWYLDLGMIGEYTAGATRKYHHTAPVAMVASLHGGLGALLAEGLEAAQQRHAACGAALQAGLQKRGLELFATEGSRLPELTTVRVPDGVDSAAVRKALLENYSIEIGGGVGPFAATVWRIGCMGHTARLRNVVLLLAALDDCLAG